MAELLKHAIDGEMLKINNNLCANAKSCVTVGQLKIIAIVQYLWSTSG